jgi:hypothetical protein
MNKLSDLQKRETALVLAKIDATLAETHQNEERLRPPSPGIEQRVWEGLVHYVNADLNVDATGYVSLWTVVRELTPAAEMTRFGLCEFGTDDDVFVLSELLSVRKRDLVALAHYYQKDLRNLLLWLRMPKSNSELRVPALKFLERHAHGEIWGIDYSDDPVKEISDFDEQRENPFLYFVTEVKYASVMAPICKFIFSRIEDIQAQSRAFCDAIPIVICKRPECGKFALPERAGRKQYCSTKCLQIVHKPSREENKHYIWLHRLKGLTPGQWRKRLKQKPEDATRLREIRKGWPRLAENFKDIWTRAGV